MKPVKKLFFCLLVMAPLLVPVRSKAGGLGGIFGWFSGIFDPHDKDRKPGPPKNTGTSVPIDGGLVVLFAAGLGLGAKVILDRKKEAAASII